MDVLLTLIIIICYFFVYFFENNIKNIETRSDSFYKLNIFTYLLLVVLLFSLLLYNNLLSLLLFVPISLSITKINIFSITKNNQEIEQLKKEIEELKNKNL